MHTVALPTLRIVGVTSADGRAVQPVVSRIGNAFVNVMIHRFVSEPLAVWVLTICTVEPSGASATAEPVIAKVPFAVSLESMLQGPPVAPVAVHAVRSPPAPMARKAACTAAAVALYAIAPLALPPKLDVSVKVPAFGVAPMTPPPNFTDGHVDGSTSIKGRPDWTAGFFWRKRSRTFDASDLGKIGVAAELSDVKEETRADAAEAPNRMK